MHRLDVVLFAHIFVGTLETGFCLTGWVVSALEKLVTFSRSVRPADDARGGELISSGSESGKRCPWSSINSTGTSRK
jgi:hypothetical protein